jgi:hypothetical protein
MKNDILEELEIGSDLSEEFSRQASYFAHWGFEHAGAESEVRRTEENKDLMWAKLQAKYRKENAGAKENEVKAYVIRNSNYRKAIELWNTAKYNRDILKVAIESFRQRKDMLIQLGADKRSELDSTDMSIRRKSEKAGRILKQKTEERTRKLKRRD